jgi:Domain of unknown function (DUF4390)
MPHALTRKTLSVPLLAVSLLAARDAGSPEIADLAVAERSGHYQASFRLESAFDEEILGRIGSGMETTLVYELEVLRRRRFWLDDRFRHFRIETMVRYDSLSGQYSLGLKLDGEVQRSSTTDRPEEMRLWMTEIRGIDLGPVSAFVPPEEFVVRVKSDIRTRFVLLFIPWGRDTSWARVALAAGPPASDESGK